MGEFEIDDLGNFIIMRGPRGELLDRKDRKVNRRGYLVDRFGNVINTQGNVIFKAVELDVDDEIPAPFGFEKRKKNLMKMKEDYNEQFKVDTSNQEITEQYIAASTQSQKQQLASAMDTEEMLEKELQEIRNQNKNYYGMATAEKEDFAASAGYSIDEIANIDAQNVDQLIDKVT